MWNNHKNITLAKIILYRSKEVKLESKEVQHDYAVRCWRPSLFSWKPKGKPFKYYLYFLFHCFGVFKSKSYAFVELIDKNTGIAAASLLVVPAHFKYEFMNKNDVQFTYVMTKHAYRGKGLALLLLQEAWSRRTEKIDNAWYVTDTKNVASIRVAEKAGFILDGYGKRKGGILNRLTKEF